MNTTWKIAAVTTEGHSIVVSYDELRPAQQDFSADIACAISRRRFLYVALLEVSDDATHVLDQRVKFAL